MGTGLPGLTVSVRRIGAHASRLAPALTPPSPGRIPWRAMLAGLAVAAGVWIGAPLFAFGLFAVRLIARSLPPSPVWLPCPSP
jgi:hypothetical protein